MKKNLVFSIVSLLLSSSIETLWGNEYESKDLKEIILNWNIEICFKMSNILKIYLF